MKNIDKFKKSLKRHQGVPVAFMINVMGAVAGARRMHEPMGFYGALFGFAITFLFWIPVLWTAWTGRNDCGEND